MKEIYLAAGCFWGTQAYFKKFKGIINTEVGYCNGNTVNPTYEEVCSQRTGFCECVYLQYDESIISLKEILLAYFKIINPTIRNRVGNDIGTNYRTGVYYTDENDKEIIDEVFNETQKEYTRPIVVEKGKLINYYKAEEYHQDYLDKNPNGYCHIPKELLQ